MTALYGGLMDAVWQSRDLARRSHHRRRRSWLRRFDMPPDSPGMPRKRRCFAMFRDDKVTP